MVLTMPPLNTPIPHNGSPECPVHPMTVVEVDDWPATLASRIYWEYVTTYTIIARAPADEIAALQARVAKEAGDE